MFLYSRTPSPPFNYFLLSEDKNAAGLPTIPRTSYLVDMSWSGFILSLLPLIHHITGDWFRTCIGLNGETELSVINAQITCIRGFLIISLSRYDIKKKESPLDVADHFVVLC